MDRLNEMRAMVQDAQSPQTDRGCGLVDPVETVAFDSEEAWMIGWGPTIG